MLLAQGNVVPVMLEGVVGLAVTTVIALHEVLLLPQPLVAYTQTFPLIAAAPKLMVMEFVPCPEAMVEPAGEVQV